MQTFLPYPDCHKSAHTLDRQRLGKQRVEALQIASCLCSVGSTGWKHHPAVKMWSGYEPALIGYTIAICQEWTSRRYKDTCREKVLAIGVSSKILNKAESKMTNDDLFAMLFNQNTLPYWFDDFDFHEAHRSNLLRKYPEYYRPMFGQELSDSIPYIWPMAKHLLNTNPQAKGTDEQKHSGRSSKANKRTTRTKHPSHGKR